jgi:hypothetical protein
MGFKIALMYNTFSVVSLLRKGLFYFVTSSQGLIKYYLLYIQITTTSMQLSISSTEVQHIYKFSCLTNRRLCQIFFLSERSIYENT